MTKSRAPAVGRNYPENGLVKPPRRDTRALSPAGMFGGKAPLRLAAQKSRLHVPSVPMRSAPASKRANPRSSSTTRAAKSLTGVLAQPHVPVAVHQAQRPGHFWYFWLTIQNKNPAKDFCSGDLNVARLKPSSKFADPPINLTREQQCSAESVSIGFCSLTFRG
jgi:hypothetical protein